MEEVYDFEDTDNINLMRAIEDSNYTLVDKLINNDIKKAEKALFLYKAMREIKEIEQLINPSLTKFIKLELTDNALKLKEAQGTVPILPIETVRGSLTDINIDLEKEKLFTNLIDNKIIFEDFSIILEDSDYFSVSFNKRFKQVNLRELEKESIEINFSNKDYFFTEPLPRGIYEILIENDKLYSLLVK